MLPIGKLTLVVLFSAGFLLSCPASALAASETQAESQSTAKSDEKDRDTYLKVDGRVNLELKVHEKFLNVASSKEGQVDIESKRYRGTKAGVDLQVSSDSGGLDLRELYLDHKAYNGNKVMVGQSKKQFGLDWDYNMEERLALTRSFVYSKLSALAYVGRNSMIGYQIASSATSPMTHDFSAHSSDGINAGLLYGLKWKLGDSSFFASYSLFQMDVVDKALGASGAQALSYSTRSDRSRFEAEVFFGKDTNETAFHRRQGIYRSVFFSAATLGASYRVFALEPFARGGYLLHDLSALSNRTLGFTLGSRFFFKERFYLGGELNLLKSNFMDGGVPDTPRGFESSSSILFALRYFI